MKNIITSLSLTAIALLFIGCGGDTATNTESTSSTSETAQAASSSSVAAGDPASCVVFEGTWVYKLFSNDTLVNQEQVTYTYTDSAYLLSTGEGPWNVSKCVTKSEAEGVDNIGCETIVEYTENYMTADCGNSLTVEFTRQ